MKKIVLGLMALTLAFSSMAQSSNQQRSEQTESHRGGGHHGGGYYEKLNLTDAQKAQAKSLRDDFKKQMQDLKNSGVSGEQLSEKRKALAKDQREKMEAILTPEQRKQAESFKKDFKDKKGDFKDNKDGAFNKDRKGDRNKGNRGERFNDLTKDLNLSADQSTKIEALNSTFKSNMQSLRANTSLSQDQKKEEVKSLMKKHKSELESLLTSDQKKQLKDRLKNRPSRTAVK